MCNFVNVEKRKKEKKNIIPKNILIDFFFNFVFKQLIFINDNVFELFRRP